MREKEEENQALLDTCDSSQGAPSGREEVLGKISPRQDPHIAVLQGIALDHKVYLGELCM